MLRILDKGNNRIKFTWSDEDEEPVSIDDLVMKESSESEEEESGEEDAKK